MPLSGVSYAAKRGSIQCCCAGLRLSGFPYNAAVQVPILCLFTELSRVPYAAKRGSILCRCAGSHIMPLFGFPYYATLWNLYAA